MAVAAPTKSQINRAAKRLARLRRRVVAGELRLQALSAEETHDYYNDLQMVEAYRSIHAYPLRMANANLRYYVRAYGERANVTQRLKKVATILDKLDRYPAMQLSRWRTSLACARSCPIRQPSTQSHRG